MEIKKLRYLAVLFGGILLVDWMLSLSLTAEATYHLTKASIDAAIAVAVLGFVFRSRLNMKITLIVTGMLSLSLAIWVFWAGHQSNAGATTHVTQSVGPEEHIVIDSAELIGYDTEPRSGLWASSPREMWRAVVHSPSKEFIITCTDYVALSSKHPEEKCMVPKVGDSWRFSVDDDGRILRLHDESYVPFYLWKIQRATLLQKAYRDGSTR